MLFGIGCILSQFQTLHTLAVYFYHHLCTGRFLISDSPSSKISPPVALRCVVSMLMVVLFPAPLGPKNPKTSPAFYMKADTSNSRYCMTLWHCKDFNNLFGFFALLTMLYCFKNTSKTILLFSK
jgi:hypothetical protein